jgi:hypothetical protein
MFANWCDKNSNIINWSSEETIIPYRCPTDNLIHRYFVDFKITINTGKTYLVEVKPKYQTIAPVYPGKRTKRYLTESYAYMKNQAKWEAANIYAKDRGWEFKIITEHELGISPK